MSELSSPPRASLDEGDIEIELPAELTHAELIDAGRDLLERARKALIETNAQSTGRAACHRFARLHDELLRALYRHFQRKAELEGRPAPTSVCMMALGGYGRRDLTLHSDIDLLFLRGKPNPSQEPFIKEILHTLYDWKLEVGHAVRTLEDCLMTIGTDLESASAMMESRLLAGSRPLYQHFQEVFNRTIRSSGRRWFLQTKFREWHERRKKYDSSVYLLEPNIKESAGGLRDVHSIRWVLYITQATVDLSKLSELGICPPGAVHKVRQAEEFLLKLRNELHAVSPRKSDVLTFEAQVEIARRLGYEATEDALGEEVLMRSYYRQARMIAKFCSQAFFVMLRREKSGLGAVIGSLRRKRIDPFYLTQGGVIFLDPKRPSYLKDDPNRIMTLFATARKRGLRVSDQTRDQIEKIVPSLGEEFSKDRENRDAFMDILSEPHLIAQTLSDMHDCGLLSAFIPEFKPIHCMVRVDHYHRYTVDEHLLKAVEVSEKLRLDPPAHLPHAMRIAGQIDRFDLLNFSLLLHDVGKGFGKGHALLGGQIIQRIGRRLELPPEDVETLRFLVLSHLKFSHVAQRRDLGDVRVAEQMAEEIGSLERLQLLYVHSVCDLMAVSPEAMTEWVAQLYETCYRVTERFIEGAPEAEPPLESQTEAISSQVWDHLSATPKDLPKGEEKICELREQLSAYIESVPDRYLQSTTIGHIARHFLLTQDLDEQNRIMWSLEPGVGVSELLVSSADRPGSFGEVCGALAAKDINILSAQVFSTRDGYAINRFQMTDLSRRPLPQGFRLERLRNDLNQVFLGKKSMEDLLARHGEHTVRKLDNRFRRPSELRIDNEISQEFTILEIRTTDRPGLLYDISKIIDEHKLNIHRAMLTTEAYGVIDVFYLTDLEYNKLHDGAKEAKLIRSLRKGLDGTIDGEADSDD